MAFTTETLDQSLRRASAALLARRHPDGYWEGRLSSSPLATAVALCALADEAGLHAERFGKAFTYLSGTQNGDGGWGDTELSKSNLAATLLVLSADALCNGLTYEQRVKARAFTEKLGGLEKGLRRVYGADLTFQTPIRMAAASAGLLPWHKVDALPFELALAPRWLMGALRLPMVSYAIPALVCVGLARHGKAPGWMPVRWLREAVADRALTLALKLQPSSGGYLEAIPITAFCLAGLKAAGRGDHPVAQNARKFLLGAQREDGSWPVEANLSVWNTTRAVEALDAAGLLHSALERAELNTTRDWLLAQQTKGVSVYSDANPGGWGWNHLSGSVPDVDDTSGAMLALRHLGLAEDAEALAAGAGWLMRLQNRDGGWPTFCRGWNKLPFDRSAPDLTAHALRAIFPLSLPYDPANSFGLTRSLFEKGYGYLSRAQRPDGSFAPLWFGCEQASDETNCTYGTANVLLACAQRKAAETIRARALSWLLGVQNTDGGFGGCKGAPSTAEETGLALRALAACGVEPTEAACSRAAEWLIAHQREDGSWNPAPIGFYFAVLWYYEELYPLCFGLSGLGALARALKASGKGAP